MPVLSNFLILGVFNVSIVRPVATLNDRNPARYDGGSIVNLAASIAHSFGVDLPTARIGSVLADGSNIEARLALAQTVFLVVLDGVGSRQIDDHVAGGCLAHHRQAELTSVFPSSTAPAITSLMTGLPPAAHGAPAWFVHDQQTGQVVRSLVMNVRSQASTRLTDDFWGWGAWMAQAQGQCTAFQPRGIHDSRYSRLAMAGARRVGYTRLPDLLESLSKVAREPSPLRQFVYVYLPQFDSTGHQFGCRSDEAATCLRTLDNWFEQLLDSVAGSGSLVVGVADHGFVDIAPAQQMQLDDYPSVACCLSAPLAGEPRTVFARVREVDQTHFDATVAQSGLGDCCDVYRSEALIDAGWLGPHAGADIRARCGTHTLVMRAGYTLNDCLPGEEPSQFVGMHGGDTSDEMLVPLIISDASS